MHLAGGAKSFGKRQTAPESKPRGVLSHPSARVEADLMWVRDVPFSPDRSGLHACYVGASLLAPSLFFLLQH